MNSLRLTAWGFLLVAFDLRIDDVDLLLDPVGWAMMVVSLWGLRVRYRVFGTAAVACCLGFVVSLPGVVAEPPWALTSVESVVQTVFVFTTCTGIVRTVPRYAEAANLVRWIDLGLMVLVVLAVFLVDESDVEALAPAVIGLGIAVLAVAVWFVVLLFRSASAAPVGQAAPAPASNP